VVAVETPEQARWLPMLDVGRAGLRPTYFHLAGLRLPGGAHEATIAARPVGRLDSGLPVPDFAEIVTGLEAERPAACLVAESGPLARLVAVAADVLGLPVFYVVASEEDLRNLSDRPKNRPDLFFLASRRLFPQALLDRRYGHTLLPVGHPARDLALRGDVEMAALAGDPEWGDGGAAGRIVEAIARWRAGTLPAASPQLTIVVPAYKEAQNLPLVCDRLLAMIEGSALEAEILLVDDHSPDETYAVALDLMWRSPRVRALTKPLPRGMGNGVRFGMRHARAPIVAVTMGDGSDEVDRIPEMFRKVHDEGFALAIGSRYRHRVNYETVPRIYRFWSWCFRLTTRVFVGFRLSDYTNAFRVFHRRIFERYGPESGGFEISPEITFKAWFATRRVAEVDVRHLKRAAGQSSFSFLRAGPGYGKILIKALVNRLTGRWFTLDW
jgi:hypothetical protein